MDGRCVGHAVVGANVGRRVGVAVLGAVLGRRVGRVVGGEQRVSQWAVRRAAAMTVLVSVTGLSAQCDMCRLDW